MLDNKTVKSTGDIYRYIYRNQASSRQKIAATLGISLPTVANGLKQLTDMGMIYHAGEFESTGGRKANMLKIVSDARFAVGIDITKTYIVFVLMDLNLKLLDHQKIHIVYENTEVYYAAISRHLEEMLERNGIEREKLLGVGISLPAIVDTARNVVTYAEIINVPGDFYEKLRPWIRYPFLLFNDANSAGWAELWQHGGSSPMVYLSLSNSVGGAIIMDKRVYTGKFFRSAEFGHITVVPRGRKCYCGKYGCLDAYCSAHALSDFTDGDLNEFFEQLKARSNKGYLDAFRQYMEYLSIAVNDLRMCFDCDVVLGGNVGPYLEEYLDEFREITCRLTPFEDAADYIKICSYRTEPSAVGAGLYFVDEFVRHF